MSERLRVVTIGGGHGQAALLQALSRLDVDISAIVSVADDGGCSGRLRQELGMPPPGDLRRCLVSLSTRPELAARFEERLTGEEAGRCVGNLVLAEMYGVLGSLERAVDWAASVLACRGNVFPAADEPGVLRVYDLEWGPLSGESAIEQKSNAPLVVTVEGPERSTDGAQEAIALADLIFFGPGSFVGSTLAALTTADIAKHVARSPAKRVLVKNLGRESSSQAGGASTFGLDDHERVLHDHLLIKSGGEAVPFQVLSHTQRGHRLETREDGSTHYASCLARPGTSTHDPELLSEAIAHHFLQGKGRAQPGAKAVSRKLPFDPARVDELIERARRRLRGDLDD